MSDPLIVGATRAWINRHSGKRLSPLRQERPLSGAGEVVPALALWDTVGPETALRDKCPVIVVDQDHRTGAGTVRFAGYERARKEPLALDANARVGKHVVRPFALVRE